MWLADEVSGLARAPKVTGIDRVDFFLAQERREPLGLANANETVC